MRYLGIDFGAKRIGVAISDEGGSIAFPRAVLDNTKQTLSLLKKDIEEQKIGCIVVGDTMSYSGLRNPVTDDVDTFIDALKRETGIPVERAFEAGSSIEASRYAPDGAPHDDSVAAAVILQRFLEMKVRSDDHSPGHE